MSESAARKAAAAEEILASLSAIQELHHAEFVPNSRLLAPAPPEPPYKQILARNVAAAVKGISIFHRARRADAKALAARQAQAEANTLRDSSLRQQQEMQRDLDGQWILLIQNDPDLVMAIVAGALEDNDATAAPIGIEGDALLAVVVVPGEHVVLDRRPTTTAAGNLSLRKMTKADFNSLYLTMVAGYVLVTAKEVFAVAPALRLVRIVVLRDAGPDAYGHPTPQVLMATELDKRKFRGIQWQGGDSVTILNAVKNELYLSQTASYALKPLNATQYPEIAEVLAAMDFGALV